MTGGTIYLFSCLGPIQPKVLTNHNSCSASINLTFANFVVPRFVEDW